MLLGTVLVLFLLSLLGAGPASAHAALTATDPADGTVLPRAPRHLTLTFSESVGLRDDSFRVLGPDGHRVRTGEAENADGRPDTVRVSLPGPDRLGKGTYTVAWRVVSADSHPVSGAFTFSVGAPSATAAPVDPGPAGDPLTGALHGTARYLAYLAGALLVGTAAFVALCRPPDPGRLRPLAATGWWTLLAATVALLMLRGPYEAGTGPAAAVDPGVLRDTLTTRPGVLLLARLVLLGAVVWPAARLFRPGGGTGRGARAAGAAPAVVLALTWAGAEHAAAGVQVPAALASAVLHLLATACWLGGLAALLTLLRRTPAGPALPAAVVTRFSRLALTSVGVLTATGVYQSWRGLGSWAALTGTPYGRLLLAKGAAVMVLVAVAGMSRRWTTRIAPAPEAPPPPPPPPLSLLRRSVLVETVVAAGVLLITTVLTGTAPGRAETEAGTEAARAVPAGAPRPASVTTIPFDIGTPGGRGTVQITLDPARSGDNAVQAVVFGADGGLTAVPELRLTFSLPARDIGPIDARLTDRGGYWSTNSVTLPLPGTWTMRATVRVSEVDQTTGTGRARVTS
ncbi:copper resistance protein CopC/CopD [Streptomyces sp. ISL-12]|uniref:copper resistance CopC/CopD family protein n=1 Tax=Streptomyces sp. ISL-12 TaxID=2819177 RepID=UPI001BEAD700|nr:copper resistance protein CopC [Streptomyces sp. ISL-12]MBT2415092.1 copper resistance protein CopC/CopD [Streptomyces sp. ISL-12]